MEWARSLTKGSAPAQFKAFGNYRRLPLFELFEFMLFEFMFEFELALAFLFLFLLPRFAFLLDRLPFDMFALPAFMFVVVVVFMFVVVAFMFVVVPDVLAFPFLLPLPQSLANMERVSRSRMTKPCFIHFSPMFKG